MLLRTARYFAQSLSGRILIALLVTLLVAVALFVVYLHQTTDELRRAVLYAEARNLVQGMNADADLDSLPLQQGTASLSYTLYNPQGEVLWFSANLSRPRKLKPNVLMPNWLSAWRLYSGKVVVVPVQLSDGNTLMVAKNDQHEREVLAEMMEQRTWRALWLVLPVSLLLSLILMPLLLLWIMRPVKQATQTAKEIGPNSHLRIPSALLPSEIRPLAEAANQALDKLAEAYEAEQQFVADAAHELRTPLTVIGLHLAQLSDKHDLQPLQQELSHMRQLVSQLLLLARLEHDSKSSAEKVNTRLSRVVRTVSASSLPRFEALNRQLVISVSEQQEQYFVQCSEHHVREILSNLLENSLLHGEGQVSVKLSATPEAVALQIEDEGQFPPQLAKALCARFRKAQQNTPGSGLGLAIVCQILRNCHGRIDFLDKANTTICVTLPRAPLPTEPAKLSALPT